MIRKLLFIFNCVTLLACAGVANASYANLPISRTGWLFASPESIVGGYTSFCEDGDGYLWVGTDTGLIRFDGASYDIYLQDSTEEGAISDNRILGLLYDSEGRLWVATANGLNLYDRSTDSFKVIRLPSMNFYGYIIAITEQTDGTVTFVVSGVGVYAITTGADGQPSAFRYLPSVNGDKDFNSLVSGNDGRLYAGTKDGCVYIISRNGNCRVVKVSNDYITGLALEDSGDLLVGDIGNIFRVSCSDDGIETLMSDISLEISELADGNRGGVVYVATSGQGLWRVDSGASEVVPCADIYSSFLNLRNASIGAVYCAPNGDLWLGCNYYGIVMVPMQQLPFMYRKLSDEFRDFGGGIKAMTAWQGNVLVGLDRGHLALFGPDGALLMNTSIPGVGLISSISLTGKDKAIVGMANDGLWELSLPDGRVKKLLDVSGKYPLIIAEPAGDKKLMVSVFGKGVMLYDGATGQESWLPCDADKGPLFNPYVECMCRADDKIWLGHYGGLSCYDLKGDSLVSIDQEPFFAGATFDITPASDGSVLVATSHGLIHFDAEKGVLHKYTTDDGLIDSDIRKIVVDDKGGRWIATLRGLSYQTPDGELFSSYRGGYGMVETSFGDLAYSADNNLVYLGSNQGVTVFRPDSLLSTDYDRSVKVSGIYLNGKKVTPSTRSKKRVIVEGESSSPTSLYLPYQENALMLRLTTRDFRDASNIQYAWRIVGENDEWMATRRGENLIFLPHLDPGSYKLQIKGVENNISSEPLELTMHISSPWYMSGPAKVLYVFIIFMLLWLLWTVRRKKRHEMENDARIRFFMDISHDIRSPVTLILSPLETLLKQPLDEDVKSKLKVMYRNCQRILSLVNQLLEIRKLEKGKIRLKCRKTNVGDFVKELVEMFTSQASEKGLSIEFSEGADVPEIWVDRDNFDKILVNLISNAIKYTPDGGEIAVRVECVDDAVIGDAVEVSVTDTGIGLDGDTVARIFDRFYQAHDEDVPYKDGFGIGLDLCKRLTEFHHGVIMGKNRGDDVKGSVFLVRLPVDPSVYSRDELYGLPGESRRRHETEGPRVVVAPEVNISKSGPKSAQTKRLLVVEDDDELRNYMCTQLGQKYSVTGVENGLEALKSISEQIPDIIVSDVVMPKIDGLTLLHRLKSNADTHHIPVVLLSSKNAVSDRMVGWEKGADAYLGKPFNVDELEGLLANLIENRLRMKGKFSGVQNTDGVIAAPDMKGNDEALMERMMKIIDRNIDDRTLNVEKLSQEVGVSRAHLHRKMKDLIGMTPSDFIRTIRLRRACELLQKGDIEVTQVAYALGFTSQPHFSSVFKKFVGVTPSEYRARWESGKAPVLPAELIGPLFNKPNEDNQN